MIIMGTIDLTKFMVKYSGSLIGIHPEYKEKIDSQASQIYAWMQKEGMTGMGESVRDLIMKEMDRIVQESAAKRAEIVTKMQAVDAGNLTTQQIEAKKQEILKDVTNYNKYIEDQNRLL